MSGEEAAIAFTTIDTGSSTTRLLSELLPDGASFGSGMQGRAGSRDAC
jgi:hypothetical protein